MDHVTDLLIEIQHAVLSELKSRDCFLPSKDETTLHRQAKLSYHAMHAFPSSSVEIKRAGKMYRA